MSILANKKQDLIKEYSRAANDTGSVEVQCAILTERIKSLTDHLNINNKDFQARRGLIHLVNQRRRLLKYLQKKEVKRYQDLIKRLGIRK